MTTHTPLRLPESMQRDDVGPYLGSLRVHFGLSEHDVADRLHIRVRYLQAIENTAFDQLPGAVYARGYLYTYAEFLGLDAQQVVDLCFGPQHPAVHVPPPAGVTAKSRVLDAAQWRGAAVVTILCAMILLVAAQLHRHKISAAPEAVPPVPEELLTINHTLVMPTPRTLDCLTGDTWSACLWSSQAAVALAEIDSNALEHQLEAWAVSPEVEADASDDGDDAAPPPLKKPASAHQKAAHAKNTALEKSKKSDSAPPAKKPPHPLDDAASDVVAPIDHNAMDGAQ